MKGGECAMENLQGIDYLKTKLANKRVRAKTRYEFYEMKNVIPDFGISTPPKLKSIQSVLGWCGKAVDSLADRLQFRMFENDDFAMGEIYQLNNADILFDSAILSALIASCCFIFIIICYSWFSCCKELLTTISTNTILC